jgi:integrase-like protein
MIVGWQLATHMRTELVLDALEMANGLRRPGEGLIAHSDRGSQYTSIRYTDRLDELGAAPSVGSRGDAYDNAMAEAWVATFKSELVDGRRFPSFEHAEHEALHSKLQERQHPNTVRHLTTPPTNPGWIRPPVRESPRSQTPCSSQTSWQQTNVRVRQGYVRTPSIAKRCRSLDCQSVRNKSAAERASALPRGASRRVPTS